MEHVATLTVGSLGEYIREQRRTAQISLRQLAAAAGVSNPYLSQIERGLRKPSAEILQQIAKGLRISAETLYVRAGILDERVGDAEVATAILADAGLTERQKNVLLDIYESFRRENAATAEPVDAPASADARPAHGSLSDAALTDAALTDAVPTDLPLTDAGATDAGATDAGATDAGATDAVPTAAATDTAPTEPRPKPRTRKTPASTTTERANKKPRTKENS
jgi:transcriptional regulator with XRE-family HTH domain